METTHAGAVHEELQPMGGPVLERSLKDCLPWGGPHAGGGEECEKEGAAGKLCYELTAPPIPHSSVPLGGSVAFKVMN